MLSERFVKRWEELLARQPAHCLSDDLPHQGGATEGLRWVFAQSTHCFPPQAGEWRVLDIGAGDGWAARLFQEHGAHYTGVSVSVEDVSAGQRDGLTFLQADMHDLPLPDASFDLVWMRHCLEHAFAPALALMEAARVTRPDGLVYVGTPRQDEQEWILAEPHYVVPTALQMENWRAKAGLHLVSYEVADEQRWLLRKGE